jgi:hypothetical protein
MGVGVRAGEDGTDPFTPLCSGGARADVACEIKPEFPVGTTPQVGLVSARWPASNALSLPAQPWPSSECLRCHPTLSRSLCPASLRASASSLGGRSDDLLCFALTRRSSKAARLGRPSTMHGAELPARSFPPHHQPRLAHLSQDFGVHNVQMELQPSHSTLAMALLTGMDANCISTGRDRKQNSVARTGRTPN